jgi:hypothetical protein
MVFVDSVNEAPEAPTLFAPADRSEVDSLRPTLVVANAVDFENDALTYAFELYRGLELTELVSEIAGVVEADSTTSFVVPVDLVEDETYTWRSRANDGVSDSEWMRDASFRVSTANHAPGAPSPISPKDVSVATPAPQLVATESLDPEGDAVDYRFQIDVRETFDSPELQDSSPVAEPRFIPPLGLSENAVYFWRVAASDGFAVSSWSAAASFRVDVANEAPSAPTPQRPSDGAFVESATPILAVINATDPEEDALTYTFEVFEDASLTLLVSSVDRLAEGAAETAWEATPRLEEGKTYYWRASAQDGALSGPPSPLQSFRVNVMNEEPGQPTLAAPAQGGIVSTPAPTLVVVNALDPDGDALTYDFEVYRDELLTMIVEEVRDVPESALQTSFTMTAALEENHVYYWRARAFDGLLHGSYMDTGHFRFSLENEAPTSPAPREPLDGSVLTESRPTLVVDNSTDPESDSLRYVFEVFRDASRTDLVVQSPEIDEAISRTSWQVDLELAENETFYWHAVATDGALSSAASVSFSFTINALDEAPTTPVLLSPADGATIATTAPIFVVENAHSPDGALGEPLVYHFALYGNAALDDLVAENAAVVEGGGGQTTWEPPVSLTPGATYFWRARAIDTRDLSSAWTDAFDFTVEPPTSDCPPEWNEDFEGVAHGTPPDGWVLLEEIPTPRFRVVSAFSSARLESAPTGRGSLLFVGTGEAFQWRNYELSATLRQEELDDDSDDDDDCSFRAGVSFYARPADGSSYRLELSNADCDDAKMRLVKIASHQLSVLAERDLDEELDDDESIRIDVEVSNDVSTTVLRARIATRKREWMLEAEDTVDPLRSGTVGAWGNFVEAYWDDFHVRELQGFESGISGDADGDGVCDVEDGPSCGDVDDVCLDEGYDSRTGLSHAVVAFAGEVGHSGPDVCGHDHSYWVRKKSGVLVVRTHDLVGGHYRFELLVHHGSDKKIAVRMPDGQVHAIREDGDDDDDGGGGFGWSKPIEVDLSSGPQELHLLSIENAKVHVEGYRLTPICEHP